MSNHGCNFHWSYQQEDIKRSIGLIDEAISRVKEVKLRGNWLVIKLMRLAAWLLKRTNQKLEKKHKMKTP